MNKKLCIIPARGGSKRIPKKNIKDFLGKPIIAYSIEAAINSGLFDEVMVSTDDEEITAVAKSYGASVPFLRTDHNSNDVATLYDAVKEVILKYQQLGSEFNTLCCLLPTAPFITANLLFDSFHTLSNSEADSLISVQKYDYPIQRALSLSKEGYITLMNPNFLRQRTQDFDEVYHDAGQLYWATVKTFLSDNKVSCGNSIPFILSTMSCQDIDNIEDWAIAEFKYEYFKSK